nr:uncharacterized protein LOC112015114 [Quercus suber]
MQVLWREALEGNCPITVDEFFYCYKPSEIKKSAGFYQFSSRGSYYSLIKGRSSSDKLWKKEFFIISGNWAEDPADVGNAPFPPFTGPLGRLLPEGTGKRKSKSISSVVDLDDLPSRQGSKKQKPGKTPPPAKTPRKPHPSESSDRPSNLVLDEGFAWRTFKGIVTDNEINECYNMSVNEFERSGIHDLFKAMSKFYTATCQAKELAKEAKTAKEKAKELNNEILLKKGEVIRLTDDFNRLLASETKLKDEVEELKANGVKKDTCIAYLEGEVSRFASSLEKAREEAILAFKKSDEYKNHLDSHYAAGYKDFRADAKEAFPDLNFDSFKLPLATENSLLQTSSEDVNIMDDANNEVT